MDEVSEEHVLEAAGAGVVGEDEIADAELPWLLEVGIGRGGEEAAKFGGAGVELAQRVVAGDEGCVGEFGGRCVELGRGEELTRAASLRVVAG